MASPAEAEHLEAITRRARQLLAEVPDGVLLVAAAKSRTAEEVAAAARGGVTRVGHNYVQEARDMRAITPGALEWHMIGHLQRNKVKAAVALFDMVETVDSWRLAQELDQRCRNEGRVLSVLLEVNSAREAGKSGAAPEEVLALVRRLAELDHLRLEGLMTLGPADPDAEVRRQAFRLARELFERARGHAASPAFRHLSMGMSDSFRLAVEEGATMLRLGTALFGPRPRPFGI